MNKLETIVVTVCTAAWISAVFAAKDSMLCVIAMCLLFGIPYIMCGRRYKKQTITAWCCATACYTLADIYFLYIGISGMIIQLLPLLWVTVLGVLLITFTAVWSTVSEVKKCEDKPRITAWYFSCSNYTGIHMAVAFGIYLVLALKFLESDTGISANLIKIFLIVIGGRFAVMLLTKRACKNRIAELDSVVTK